MEFDHPVSMGAFLERNWADMDAAATQQHWVDMDAAATHQHSRPSNWVAMESTEGWRSDNLPKDIILCCGRGASLSVHQLFLFDGCGIVLSVF